MIILQLESPISQSSSPYFSHCTELSQVQIFHVYAERFRPPALGSKELLKASVGTSKSSVKN